VNPRGHAAPGGERKLQQIVTENEKKGGKSSGELWQVLAEKGSGAPARRKDDQRNDAGKRRRHLRSGEGERLSQPSPLTNRCGNGPQGPREGKTLILKRKKTPRRKGPHVEKRSKTSAGVLRDVPWWGRRMSPKKGRRKRAPTERWPFTKASGREVDVRGKGVSHKGDVRAGGPQVRTLARIRAVIQGKSGKKNHRGPQ